MLLTETIHHVHNQGENIMITFMDVSKAVDIMCQPGLLNILHDQGIKDNLWHLYNSMYTDINAKVKWQGHISS